MEFDATGLDRVALCERSLAGETVPPSCSPFLDEAIAATAAGLVVLPCGGPTGKAPLVKWKTLDRPISPARLKKWRADPQFAEANIGIATGASGITVIDCDTPDSLDRLIARFGPTPLIVATPRGGHHLYYRSSGERSGPLRDGDLQIDIKADGGFIVIPPSIRRTGEHAGREYRLISGSWADVPKLPPIREGALAPIFSEARASASNSPSRCSARDQSQHGSDIGHRNRALFDALRGAALKVENRGELADVACALNHTFDPPLDDAEVAQTTESVWGYREEGRLFTAGRSMIAIPGTTFDRLSSADNGADGLMLISCLIRNHGARAARNEPFAIVAAKMVKATTIKGWAVTRYRNAIDTLLANGFLNRVHKGGRRRGDPHRYLLNLAGSRNSSQLDSIV